MSYTRWVLLPALIGALVALLYLVYLISHPYVHVRTVYTFDSWDGDRWVDRPNAPSERLRSPENDRELRDWLAAQPGVVECSVERDTDAKTLTIDYAQEGYQSEPQLSR